MAAEYVSARTAALDAEALLDEGGLDAVMKEYLVEEKAGARETMERLEDAIRLATLEKDPRDEKDIIVEIRAVPGVTKRPCRRRAVPNVDSICGETAYKHEVLSTSESGLGGIKEIVFAIRAVAPTALQARVGGAPVQRVPVTESTGASTPPRPQWPCCRSGRG